MKTAATLIVAALGCASAFACDKVDAAKVHLALSEMGADWSERDGRVVVEWGRAWDGAARVQRLELLRTFAGTDTCLSGKARQIDFYRKGQRVALVRPPAGVELAREAASAPVPAVWTASGTDLMGCPN